MEGVAANICRRIKVFSSVTTKRVHLAERTLQANDVVRRYGDGRTTETIASGEPDRLTRTSGLPAAFRSARPAAARDDTAFVQKKTNVVSIGCGLSRICRLQTGWDGDLAWGKEPKTLTYLLSYLFIPWSRVLLEKLTGSQLVKKFSAFYGNRWFITAFTSARHLSLSWVSSTQSIPPHPTSWRSVLILFSHLSLGLPSGLFPSSFPTKTLYTPLISSIRATCPAHLILLDFITRKMLREENRSFSSSSCSYLFPLRPKYSPQHPTLKHPKPTFLPQCDRPSFTPIQNNRQNYSSVYLNLYIFGFQTGTQNILHRMYLRNFRHKISYEESNWKVTAHMWE